MDVPEERAEDSMDVDAFTGSHDQTGDEAGAMNSLPSCCTVLTCNDPTNFGREQTFYIVGTAHVSTESCEDVKRVIRLVKPEVCKITILFIVLATCSTVRAVNVLQ